MIIPYIMKNKRNYLLITKSNKKRKYIYSTINILFYKIYRRLLSDNFLRNNN